jgi:hypothetical protein
MGNNKCIIPYKKIGNGIIEKPRCSKKLGNNNAIDTKAIKTFISPINVIIKGLFLFMNSHSYKFISIAKLISIYP